MPGPNSPLPVLPDLTRVVDGLQSIAKAINGLNITLSPTATPLLKANNLSDVASVPTSRANLNLNNEGLLFDFQGVLSNGQVALAVLPYACSLPAGLAGSGGRAITTATSSAVFTINKITAGGASSAIGSATFGSGIATPTFTFASTIAFNALDSVELVGPNPADATLADVGLMLLLTRT